MIGSCPQCKNKVLEEVAKCPHCGYAAPLIPPAIQGEPVSEWKKCPYCAEQIRAEAVVCRYCNKDLQQRPVAMGPAPKTSEIVQQGVAKDAERRPIIAEVRRRRALARLMAAGCILAAIVAVFVGMDSPRRGLTPSTFAWAFFSLGLFIAYLVARPRYTGAECPHCHSFAVWRGSRSGCISTSYFLKCEDCESEFGGANAGGCSCLGMIVLLGSLASGIAALLLIGFR